MNPQSVVANAAVASGGRVVSALLGLVVTAVIFRFLGAAGYGQYVLVLSLGALLQMLADSGLYLTLTRLIAAQPARRSEYISHILWLRWMLFGLVFGGSLLVVGMVPIWRPLWWLLLIASGGLWFQSFSQLLMGVYQVQAMVWPATVGDVLGRLVQLGVIALIFRGSLGVPGALLAFAVSSVVAWGIHYWLLPVQRIITRPSRDSWPAWQLILREAWPLGLMLLLNAVYFRIDTILLSWLRSPAEVGVYGVAYGVIEKLLFFPAMFGGLLLPRLAAALADWQLPKAAVWVRESLQLMLLAAVAILVIGIPLAPALMVLLTGQASLAGLLLQVLLLALAAMFAGNIFGFCLVAGQKQQVLVGLYAGLVIFNVVTNLIFIPRWGALAAAWTTVATELLSAGVAGLIVWRQLGWRMPVFFIGRLGLIVGLTLLLLIVMPAHWSVLARGLIAALGYMGAAWGVGLFDRRHYSLLYAGL